MGSEIGRGLDIVELTPSAFISQNEIDAATIKGCRAALSDAEGKPGSTRRSAQTTLVTQLTGAAQRSTDATKVTKLTTAVRALGAATPNTEHRTPSTER